jgi:hypothetical protein
VFQVGETYTITLRENGDNTLYGGCKIVSVQMPLIKITQNGSEKVLNTGSLSFVSAEKDR